MTGIILLISSVTITSLLVNGVHQVTREGMLLSFVSRYAVKILGDRLAMPLTECVVCMAGSVWNIIVISVAVCFGHVQLSFGTLWPLFILNGLISAFVAVFLRVAYNAFERVANNSIEDSIDKAHAGIKSKMNKK